jgi:hypothetical protein
MSGDFGVFRTGVLLTEAVTTPHDTPRFSCKFVDDVACWNGSFSRDKRNDAPTVAPERISGAAQDDIRLR